MPDSVVLAFDIGTSSVKTSMMNSKGVVLDAVGQKYDTIHASGGVSEQNPEDWWGAVCKTTNELMRKHPKADIAVIGISGHMLGCLPVDAYGNVLCNCMIHSDLRAYKQYEHILNVIGEEMLYNMSGNVISASSTLCKMLWIKECRPEIYAHTAKFHQSKDYIVSKLTGVIDTTDYSDACHGVLMNIMTKKYKSELFSELGLDIAKLAKLHKSTDVVGKVTKQSAEALGICAGIPVIAGGGDGACGNVGAACVNNGEAYICLGSTAWIAQCVDAPFFDSNKRVFNIMNVDGKTTTLFGTVQSACSAQQWAMNLLGITDAAQFSEIASKAKPGCQGLVFQPYLDGERSPVFDANAKGTLIGLSSSHGKEEFARAILEGVALALADILDIFRENNDISDMRIIGGGSKSELWKQIISDICKVEIKSLSVSAESATSLGAAVTAGVAVGMFPNIKEAVSFIKMESVNKPIKENVKAYKKNIEVYRQIYENNKKFMHILSE